LKYKYIMHPPLNRPHPDCNDVIQDLKICHESFLNKISGQCNTYKFRLDACLKEEKKRLLAEMNKDLPQHISHQEEIIKQAFGKQQTFSEYLAQDAEYQRVSKQQKQARSS